MSCYLVQFCGALFNLGKALGMQGRADEATKAYGRAIEVLFFSGARSACCPECSTPHVLKANKIRTTMLPASLGCLGPWQQA